MTESRNNGSRPRAERSSGGRKAAGEVLLRCTPANTDAESNDHLSRMMGKNFDWDYLVELADNHGITPLLLNNLTSHGLADRVPAEQLEHMNQTYQHTLFRNLVFSHELNSVLTTFQENGISAIVLKGVILAEELYGNPGLRPMSDMDILVPHDQIERAGELLLEMGYRQPSPETTWDHPFHESPFYKKKPFMLVIELHWRLDDDKLVEASHDAIWSRARWFRNADISAMTLSPEDNLLYLSHHFSKHSDHILRLLNDIVELLKKFNGTLDWDYAIQTAREWGIGTVLYYTLKRAQEMLGAPVPAPVFRTLRPKAWRRWLLEFVTSPDLILHAKASKLRGQTQTLVRSLMMEQFGRSVMVFTGSTHYKKISWPKAIFWITVVFGAAIGRRLGILARL